MITGTITHDEAVIQHFIEDPEYADLYLQTVLEDGDKQEISKVVHRYEEAKLRTFNMGYWGALVENAKKTAQGGKNLDFALEQTVRAMSILKAATLAPSEAV